MTRAMTRAIVPIVEGHSEVFSVPILLRRLMQQGGTYDLEVAKPFRVKRDLVVRPGGLEKALEFASLSRPNAVAILVLLDADDDCPAKLGPELAKRCLDATQLPTLVVHATREFEGWILGAKESLRGVRGIRNDAVAPEKPERIRGAKERLSKNMEGSRRYLSVDDQPAFVERMDFELAHARCPSFARFVRRFGGLVSRLTAV